MPDDHEPGCLGNHGGDCAVSGLIDPPTPVVEWWHVWKGELAPDSSGESQGKLTITLGPTHFGPDDVGMDGKDIKIRDRTFPMGIFDPDGPQGPEAQYFASFTHDPSDEEQGLEGNYGQWDDEDDEDEVEGA